MCERKRERERERERGRARERERGWERERGRERERMRVREREIITTCERSLAWPCRCWEGRVWVKRAGAVQDRRVSLDRRPAWSCFLLTVAFRTMADSLQRMRCQNHAKKRGQGDLLFGEAASGSQRSTHQSISNIECDSLFSVRRPLGVWLSIWNLIPSRQASRQAAKQTGRQARRQAGRQAGRQTGKQARRQARMHVRMHAQTPRSTLQKSRELAAQMWKEACA